MPTTTRDDASAYQQTGIDLAKLKLALKTSLLNYGT